jgi:D-serine deaminase-like pyridoxal phosphate-dependent protein
MLQDLDAATADLEPPFAAVDLDAFDANAAELLRRARGKRVRLATKSVRCRALIDRALGAGFTGLLSFTLPEAIWLDRDDVVVAYPTVDRAALAARTDRITLMADCREHLDLIGSGSVSIDVDASWWPLGGALRIGAKRSPLRTAEQAAAFAREILARGMVLDGLMMYEAQIAGVGDDPGNRLLGVALRAMQRASGRELAARRAAVVAAVREVAPLRFVNGGGTGSIGRTAAEPAVTEIAAGSGLFAPTLFDAYRAFRPRPAAFFALPVVRRPSERAATVLGGGYPASGPAGRDRLPRPAVPGLRLDRQEGAGEVQTPLLGPGARGLRIGDRVWMRHAKAGELCERFDVLHLVQGGRRVATVPTYRGEGRAFL